jgi:hypothetical protein
LDKKESNDKPVKPDGPVKPVGCVKWDKLWVFFGHGPFRYYTTEAEAMAYYKSAGNGSAKCIVHGGEIIRQYGMTYWV